MAPIEAKLGRDPSSSSQWNVPFHCSHSIGGKWSCGPARVQGELGNVVLGWHLLLPSPRGNSKLYKSELRIGQ